MKSVAENESLLQRYEHDEMSSKYFLKPDKRYSMPEDDDGDDELKKREKKVMQVRKWPTICTALFVGFGWLINEVALAWIHERVPTNSQPLPDLWFSVFPEIRGAIRITEYIMLILIINAVIVMFTHQHRWIVVRRAFFCIAFSYCFRALCITIFQVPVPSVNTYCAPKSNSSLELVFGRVSKMFWSAGIEQLRPRELCGDLIVSGHTLIIFTSFLIFKTYSPKKLLPLTYLYHFMAFVAVFSILIARKHYMIDVVLGYTVSTRIFMEYHSLAASYHENNIENNALSWSWWSCLIPFLECDAPASFHNHLILPGSPTKPRKSSE